MTLRDVLQELALGDAGLFLNCIDIVQPNNIERDEDFLPRWAWYGPSRPSNDVF